MPGKSPPLFTYIFLGTLLLIAGSCNSNTSTDGKKTPSPSPSPSTNGSMETTPKVAPGSAYFGPLPYTPLDAPLTPPTTGKHSVVLIVVDTLNAKHLHTYGYHRQTSPHMDALAQEGLVLDNYVSNSSWTRPSYTTIITGLPKKDHGVELEGGWRLKPEIRTLAERFRDAGYRTASFSGNPLVRKAWGFDQGFQTYEDPSTLHKKAFFPDSTLIELATRWLSQKSAKPSFLVLFLTAPHAPYRPPLQPRTFMAEVKEGTVIEHPFKEYKTPMDSADHEKTVAAYDDEIAYTDQQIGRLMAFLDDSGQKEKTVVAVTADHGEVMGDHNCYTHTYHMWEPALRVPLILRWPGQAEKGALSNRPFTHVDIAPTLLRLVGIPYAPDELPGLSITDTLQDREANKSRIRFSQYNAHGIRRQAIRQDGLKLVHHHQVESRAEKSLNELESHVEQANPRDLPTLAWDGERYELYDLTIDPEENTNLFEARKADPRTQELLADLKQRIAKPTQTGELTEEMIQALENAGYLQKRENN